MKTNTLFSKAFEYAVHGYSVMPLRKDKKPLLATWKKYQQRAATEEEITKWWNDKPDANIGIITGKVSGIIVVDIDTGGDKVTPLEAFPATYTVKTPTGGYHLYYEYVEGFTISANAYPQYPHVDIRGDGGFVVAPPSVAEYTKGGKDIKGEYTIFKKVKLAPFPAKLFGGSGKHKKISEVLNVGAGKRNDSMASLIGKLLRSSPLKEWQSEVWPAVERLNKDYKPPLRDRELKTTFDSIVKKEKARLKGMVESPFQVEGGEEVRIPIRKASNGSPYKDMANALAVLEHHPYYKGTLKYNSFRNIIEYNGVQLEDAHLYKMQLFMQKEMELSSIAFNTVAGAVEHYAHENSYDEVKDWLTSITWDKKPRLATWIAKATGVPEDNYHAGIGAQWFLGLVSRIMQPGCIFDYVLVFVGPQGIGKTSLFRIIGGKWYKNYTGTMDNKDFSMSLQGALIMDLDEGASLYRSDAIKIKSIISNTHDEFRAPFGRLMKKFPRRFVFSMSTNDTEPFKDVTGNRRYWTIDGEKGVDFKWLEANRDQLFAEAEYHRKNKIELPEVPIEEAREKQEMHLAGDSWAELLMKRLQESRNYCEGDEDFSTTIAEMYQRMFQDARLETLGKGQEMRIAALFKKEAGLERKRRMVEGEQSMRWYLTAKRVAELKAKNLKVDDF